LGFKRSFKIYLKISRIYTNKIILNLVQVRKNLFDWSILKMNKSEGCPFAKNSTLTECPVSGTKKEEKNETFQIFLSLMQFSKDKEGKDSKENCPFNSEEYQKLVEKCPKFQEECPFKGINTVEDLSKLVDTIPVDHPKCSAFEGKLNETKKVVEKNELFETLMNRRWDLFFEEPLKYIELATKLKDGTLTNHMVANNMPFVQKFIKLQIKVEEYRRVLSQMYYIYEAMEEELEKNKNHPLIKEIYYPLELNRFEAIKEDLKFFYGTDYMNLIQPIDSIQLYAGRIREISKKNPSLLIAHSYTRYLGDLAGGQILKAKAKKALDLDEENGTKFYDFPNISNQSAFKQEYRQKLNNLNINENESLEIVKEANLAFEFNIKLFEELDSKYFKNPEPKIFKSQTEEVPAVPGNFNFNLIFEIFTISILIYYFFYMK
jgi:heme oxygenase (biliverdin-producing, ferredoxin)